MRMLELLLPEAAAVQMLDLPVMSGVFNASRLSLVYSLFALITQYVAVLRYHGGCD